MKKLIIENAIASLFMLGGIYATCFVFSKLFELFGCV